MGYGRFLALQVSTILLTTSATGQFNPSPVDPIRTGGNLNQQPRVQTVQNDFVPVVPTPAIHRPRQVGPERTFSPTMNMRPQNLPQTQLRRPSTNHLVQQNPFPQEKLQSTTTVVPSQQLQEAPIPLNQIRATSVQQTTANQVQQPSATDKQTRPVNVRSASTMTHPAQRMEAVTLSPEQILFKEQAENAKYSFDAAVTDKIMDHTHVRKESRDGLALSGLYSYSDGYYKRTVHYQADENGYRVTKEQVEPIGEGPQVNLDGDAVVSTNVGGVDNRYRITAADIAQWQEEQESSEAET